MKNQTYITFYKKKATDTDGYLFLQSKGRENRKKKAIGIKVSQDKFIRFWNDKDQRFKSGIDNYKILNETIAKALEIQTKETGEIIEVKKEVKQSFLKYWDRQIELIPNIGSKGKHIVVKKKLEKYLQTLHKNDIAFSEITPDFIKDIHYNFKTDSSLSTNSVNSYMKLINNIIRRKIKDDPYTFTVNPFATVKYDKKAPAKRVILTDKEVDRLLTTKINDKDLDFVRDMFVFQIFGLGMRVSDLCLLRWNTLITDISNWKQYENGSFKINHLDRPSPIIEYVMFKTTADMEVPLTFYVCKALLKAIDRAYVFDEATDPSNILMKYNGKWLKYTEEIEPEIKNNTFKINEPNTFNYKGYVIKRDNEKFKNFIDVYLLSKRAAINNLITETASNILVHLIKNKCANDFIFPILKSNDFKNISDSDRTFKDVISKDEDLHHKLEYGKKIYRRQLDKVGDLCKISEINPHAARHTFALLMSNAGASTHNIMDDLGHTTLNVTDSYMRHKKFKNKKGENYLDIIGNSIDYLDNE